MNMFAKAFDVMTVFLLHCLCRIISRVTPRTFRFVPLCNRIVLECESDMDDNPRAIYEYLLNRKWNNGGKIVWIVKNPVACQRLYGAHNVTFISRRDGTHRAKLRLNYYLGTSKWFIFSHPYWFHKPRKTQVVVNINHGTAMKGRSATDDDTSQSYDMVLAPTVFSSKYVTGFWGCERDKVVVGGYPRNDYLLSPSAPRAAAELFHIGPTEKFVICMPTYKKCGSRVDSSSEDSFSLGVISSEDELFALNKFLANNACHIIVKIHPLQDLDSLKRIELSNIHYVNNKMLFERRVILYDLIGLASGLITDLSSVYFDYLLLDRPVGLLMSNIRSYTRGFIFEDPNAFLKGFEIWSIEDMIRFIGCVLAGDDGMSEERKKINYLFNPPRPKESYSADFCKLLFSL